MRWTFELKNRFVVNYDALDASLDKLRKQNENLQKWTRIIEWSKLGGEL